MSLVERAQWLDYGERCPASNTLYNYTLAGLTGGIRAFPRDAADLRRCRLLLEMCPDMRQHLHRVAGAGLEWAQFVSFWDDICLVQDLEDPNWRQGLGMQKRVNAMIDSFIDASTTSKGERKA